MREQWFANNLYHTPITVALNITPAISIGGTVDLLRFSTKEQVCGSENVKYLLRKSFITITQIIDGQVIGNFNNTNFDDLCSGDDAVSPSMIVPYTVVNTSTNYQLQGTRIILLCDTTNGDIL